MTLTLEGELLRTVRGSRWGWGGQEKLALLANGEINSGLIRSYPFQAKYHGTLITEKIRT